MSTKYEWSCEPISIALLRVYMAIANASKPMSLAQKNALVIKSLVNVAKTATLTGATRRQLYVFVERLQQIQAIPGQQLLLPLHRIYEEAYTLMVRALRNNSTKDCLLNALEQLRGAGFHVNAEVTEDCGDVPDNAIYILNEHMKHSFDEEGNNIGFFSLLVRGNPQVVINVCYEHEILLAQIPQAEVDGSFNTHFQIFNKRHHDKHCLVKLA